MEAHFKYFCALDLKYILELVEALNRISDTWHNEYAGIRVMKVNVCNDVGEKMGLIYFNSFTEQYNFVPDMTGEGIDEEKLAW